jgi:hypothetical protein
VLDGGFLQQLDQFSHSFLVVKALVRTASVVRWPLTVCVFGRRVGPGLK